MFSRVGAAAYKKDLHNIVQLVKCLDHPEKEFKSIHVAGTNGKGSTSHMFASIFQEAGYKTGLYTSPHLIDFRERIKINGKDISENDVIEFVEKYATHFEHIQPSFFEWTLALCFHHFAKEKVDIAIIETGLGGRLDSTNIINPLLSVVTNIGLDHTDLLGNDLATIAFEKAGIIKAQVPVVIGETVAETKPVFLKKATDEKSPIYFANDIIKFESFVPKGTYSMFTYNVIGEEGLKQVLSPLHGIYQIQNISTVLAACQILKLNLLKSKEPAIAKGIEKTIINTGLMGRWQKISESPLVICDTGHNEHGMQQICQQLKGFTNGKIHCILGMVKDKSHAAVLHLLPTAATYYFTKAHLPRALGENELQNLALTYNLNGAAYPTVIEAYQAAIKAASSNDLIFIGGSTFVVADFLIGLNN
jgi:dihydrofolate synthase/folylpolyglutamate synthase